MADIQSELTLFSEDDIYLFNEGSHFRLGNKLGLHLMRHDGVDGAYVAIWAPNAKSVSLVGDFNGWDRERNPLQMLGNSGVWEGFVPGVAQGDMYKFFIRSRWDKYEVEKADPCGHFYEEAPKTASVAWDLSYDWEDRSWMETRGRRQANSAPISIYELHVGSWMRHEDGRSLTYRELAPKLIEHVVELGFTHVEFLPLTEHPFYGSWGYQCTGFFAPTSRFGTPQDLMYLIDQLHQHEIGVILDWVPSHFPADNHGLQFFDGTHLFEHADPRQGVHPDWGSLLFNYGRNEVRSFLTSSAMFWLEKFHIDGLRVDAVASMLYLDYSREDGEWIPNHYGGRENLEALHFVRRMNEAIRLAFPDVLLFAEESAAWPGVTAPIKDGGLGFHYKWDMGWMHDTLQYLAYDPIYRKYHQNQLTFRMMYAFSEQFCLPLSHDEVVHGKGSLLQKMPGDWWQKHANLRLLYGYMYGMPGKKLLFMGGEHAQITEWSHDEEVAWFLLNDRPHQGMRRWVGALNRFYREESAMHALDVEEEGFFWIDCSDEQSSVVSFIRQNGVERDYVLCVCNFTPVARSSYRIGVPREGAWEERLNSDASEYGGSGQGNWGRKKTEPIPYHNQPHSISLILPPLSVLFFTSHAP